MLFCGVFATILAHIGVIVQRCTFKEKNLSKMQLSHHRSDFQNGWQVTKTAVSSHSVVSVTPVSLQWNHVIWSLIIVNFVLSGGLKHAVFILNSAVSL